jgi:hypothetical protein
VCTGAAGQACPSDTIAPSGTLCRAAAGSCDAVESCAGTADAACPADAKLPSGSVCRAASGVCDLAEACNGVSDACPADVYKANDTPCSDGQFCNGNETCQSNVCTDGPDPCGFTSTCNESTDQCVNTVCPSGPEADCRLASKNLLLIKNKTFNGSDKLVWKFAGGAATTQTEFSDPTNSANYALCIYAGTTNALVASLNVPPSGTAWRALGTKGYKYYDPGLAADGTQKIILKGDGTAGKTKALVKGRADNLPDPIDVAPLQLPVTAQLLNYQTGICWESSFNAFSRNTTSLFKAKTP